MIQSMDPVSLVLLSIGLAMDAFSVALVAGLGLGRLKIIDSLRISSSFGAAHILMPILGWTLGSTIITLIQGWDHWLAFILLGFVGGKMIKEGMDDETEEIGTQEILSLTSLILFTIAVSIDALAVGLSFSLEKISIWIPSLFMGAGTFLFTFIGLNIGNKTGQQFGNKAKIFGGLILILIGLRILVTHVF